jgi:hypothetical protein
MKQIQIDFDENNADDLVPSCVAAPSFSFFPEPHAGAPWSPWTVAK